MKKTLFTGLLLTMLVTLGGYTNSAKIAAQTEPSTTSIMEVSHLKKETALKLLKAVVRVKQDAKSNGSGSGVVIFSGQKKGSKEYHTYILTCNHVISEKDTAYAERFIYPKNKKVEVILGFNGTVVCRDEKLDLAVIEVVSALSFPETLVLASDKDIDDLSLYDSAYTVGCALGDLPYITNGNIANFDAEGFFQTTAPSIFGNSGGPVCLASGKILGIVSRIRGVRAPDRTVHPYPFASLVIPAPTINTWLKGENMGFLISNKESLDDYLTWRKEFDEIAKKIALEEAQKKAAKEALDKALKEAREKAEKEKKEKLEKERLEKEKKPEKEKKEKSSFHDNNPFRNDPFEKFKYPK